MDGFTGIKTATTAQLPDAIAVMDDPFDLLRLAGDALDERRRRINRTHAATVAAPQTTLPGTRSRHVLPDRQHHRLKDLFVTHDHVEIETTWGIPPTPDRRLPRPPTPPRENNSDRDEQVANRRCSQTPDQAP